MKYFFAFFIILSIDATGQGINNLWLMGYQSWGGPPFGGVNLDFTGGNLNITYQNRAMNFSETNGVICDKTGSLLFSSNGIYITNAFNDTMINGSGLNPSTFTTSKDSTGLPIPQANLIIPFPEDSNKYYLFHETADDNHATYCSFYLYYSTIDMAQDGGKGAVIQKNIILQNDSLIEGRLTACKHANGRDWWLVFHHYNNNRYYKYLITPYQILGPYLQDIGSNRGNDFGQAVFSPDGSKFAYYEYKGDLDIMDFDRCSGTFSNLIHVDINDSAACSGVAFSPNSKVLYVSSMRYVYQFDLTVTDIPASKTTVATWDGYYSPSYPLATLFYLSQLAPDGKIYINCGNATLDVHVINKPDSLGLACDLQQHSIHLPAFNAFTIPNHPNYFLGPWTGSICDSLGIGIDELFGEDKINVYPNPVSSNGEVTFTYPSSGEIKTISIFNVEGKEVAQYTLPQWSSVQHLKLPNLAEGVYMARIMGNEQSSNVKFVVK